MPEKIDKPYGADRPPRYLWQIYRYRREPRTGDGDSYTPAPQVIHPRYNAGGQDQQRIESWGEKQLTLPRSISNKIMPYPHTSMALVYPVVGKWWSRISGAKYPAVPSGSVMRASAQRFSENLFANPKSAIATWPLGEINTLSGFKSRCTIRRECRDRRPRSYKAKA